MPFKAIGIIRKICERCDCLIGAMLQEIPYDRDILRYPSTPNSKKCE